MGVLGLELDIWHIPAKNVQWVETFWAYTRYAELDCLLTQILSRVRRLGNPSNVVYLGPRPESDIEQRPICRIYHTCLYRTSFAPHVFSILDQ